MSNLECKTSAYQYYQKLRRLTCPAFPKAILNRYQELQQLSREYRNMKLWKMHGWSHDEPNGSMDQIAMAMPHQTDRWSLGIDNTILGQEGPYPLYDNGRNERDQSPTVISEGEKGKLASFCPTCPQLGINLPDSWVDDLQRYEAHHSVHHT